AGLGFSRVIPANGGDHRVRRAEDFLGRLAINRGIAVAVDELRERARGVLHHDLTCGWLLRGQDGVAACDPGAQVVLAHLIQDLLPALLVDLSGIAGWRSRGVGSSVGRMCCLLGRLRRRCGRLTSWLLRRLFNVLGLGIPSLGLLTRRLFTASRRAGLRLRLGHGASALALTCSRLLRCLARVRTGGGAAAIHDLPSLAGLGDRWVLVRGTGRTTLLRRWCSTLLLLRVIRRLLGASCLRGLLHGRLLRLRCRLLGIVLGRCLLARLTGLR